MNRKNPLSFTGSNTKGHKAQIRQSDSPYEHGFSVFIWRDDGSGVYLWRENHGLEWEEAFKVATEWLSE